MPQTYVLLGSFDGVVSVVVGVFNNFNAMLDDIENGYKSGQNDPEIFEVSAVFNNSINRTEQQHKLLWVRSPKNGWSTRTGERPKSIDDLV